MAETTKERFFCPSCGKKFRFTDAVAGKKVTCTGCGQKFVAPTEPGGSATPFKEVRGKGHKSASKDEPEDPGASDSVYALNVDEPAAKPRSAPSSDARDQAGAAEAKGAKACPSCGQQLKSGAVICLNCGYNLKEGSKIETDVQVTPPPDLAEDESDGGRPAGSIPSAMAATAGIRTPRSDEPPTEEQKRQRRIKAIVLSIIAVLCMAAAAYSVAKTMGWIY